MSKLQVKLKALGDDKEQLIHLLFPLKRDRPCHASNVSRVPLFRAFLSILKLHLRTIYGRSFEVFDLSQMQDNCILLLSDTINQSQALAPLNQSLQEREMRVTWCKDKRFFRPSSNLEHLKIFASTLSNIFRHGFLRNVGSHGVARLYMLFSEVARYAEEFNNQKPESILISNDHNRSMMAILFAAHLKGIPVDYVQHAHVTRIFPEPRYLRHIFTDGWAATQVYKSLAPPGCRVEYHPIGPVRFEQSYFEKLDKGQPNPIDGIGLALDFECSMLCDRSLQNLANLEKRNINVRFHPRTEPAMRRRVIDLLTSSGFQIEVFNQDSSAEFLLSSRLIFTGDSSVILDAALFGCIPICISNQKSDYYGFIESGLSNHLDVIPSDLEQCESDRHAQVRRHALSKYICKDFLNGTRPLPSERIAETIWRSNGN